MMQGLESKPKLELPANVSTKLLEYRRRVRTVKLIEGLGAAAFGLCVSYLIVFILDRFFDTNSFLRGSILVTGSMGMAIWFPLVCHKWIWKSRRLEQVARILKTQHPRIGDYLLGIIELVHSDGADGRSDALCRAALQQADRETAAADFSNSVPNPRHYRWTLTAGVPLLLAVIAFLIVPSAGSNAFWRWAMPWRSIERYTFARIDELPEKLVVPVAEPSQLQARLSDQSLWNPNEASAWLGSNRVAAIQDNGLYDFKLPALKEATRVQVSVGDVRKSLTVDPQPRPELEGLSATIRLPDYLQRTEPLRRDIRGGTLTVAEGSQFAVTAKATRPLAEASVDGEAVQVDGQRLETLFTAVEDSRTLEFAWRDTMGLAAKTPLRLKIRAVEDEMPTIACRELDQQVVLMEKDVLSFQVDASDDFGVRTLGMEWKGSPTTGSDAEAAAGERVIYAGNPEAEEVTAISATFSPQREGIQPQTIQLRLFAEDYFPDRPRVYSPMYTVFLLSEDEHAIWMTRRLDEWFKQSLETYEREQQLYKRNVELRQMDGEELDRPENRRKIEAQAAAEQAQSRRMEALTEAGTKLVKEAARNEQFGVDHLEKLAEMVQRMQDIANDRMPSVADLLKQAADAKAGTPGESGDAKPDDAKPADGPPSEAGAAKKAESAPAVTDDPGKRNEGKAGTELEIEEEDEQKPKVPSISLKESSMDQPEETKEQEAAAASKSGAKFTLPSVTLNDPNKKPGGACPAGEKMQEAVDQQEELLAEFQAIAEELQKLIGNLEGSTFVKRLKALSRRELVLASDIDSSTLASFGAPLDDVKEATQKRTALLAERQRSHSQTLQHVMDDLEAYANRVQEGKYKTVLKEMTDDEIVKQVALVAERMTINEPGTSIAHAELLADTFDRWAEQLVGPG